MEKNKTSLFLPCFYLYVDMQHSAHDFQLLSPGCSAFPTILVVLTNTCPAQEVSAASGSIRRAIGLARIISSAKLSSCSRSSATWEMHRDDIRKVGWRWLEQVCKSWNSGSGTVNAKRGHGEYRCVCVPPFAQKIPAECVNMCECLCECQKKPLLTCLTFRSSHFVA